MKIIPTYCCDKCFCDVEICGMIQSLNKKGKCDICDATNVYVYNFKENFGLTELLNELLELYSLTKDLPEDFPARKLSTISYALKNDWHIFNVKPEIIYELITNVCWDKYINNKDFFSNTVGMGHTVNNTFLESNSILGTSTWEAFVEEIKFISRFHTKIINLEMFHSFLRVIVKVYTENSSDFYRTRICTDSCGYTRENMGAPPPSFATAGRANAEGISYLYLSTDINTTIHETKAFLYDYVTVATFKPLTDLKIVDLTSLDKISPFILRELPSNSISLSQYSVNLENIEKISGEISKPLRRMDSSLDYLPTQFICDYIRSKGFDGIEYKSTVDNKGRNLAIFDPSKLACIEANVYEIDSISYRYTPL